MNWLKGLLLALTVVASWTALLFVLAPAHQLMFTVIPPDGPVSATERIQIDRSVSKYLLTGGRTLRRAAFTQQEQRHMADVRTLWLALVGIAMVGGAVQLWRPASENAAKAAAWITVAVGFASFLSFSAVFVRLHELVFPNQDWLLPTSLSVLTRVYPEQFFLVSWALVLGCSLLSMLLWIRSAQGRCAR